MKETLPTVSYPLTRVVGVLDALVVVGVWDAGTRWVGVPDTRVVGVDFVWLACVLWLWSGFFGDFLGDRLSGVWCGSLRLLWLPVWKCTSCLLQCKARCVYEYDTQMPPVSGNKVSIFKSMWQYAVIRKNFCKWAMHAFSLFSIIAIFTMAPLTKMH